MAAADRKNCLTARLEEGERLHSTITPLRGEDISKENLARGLPEEEAKLTSSDDITQPVQNSRMEPT
jgi:hypothetical protein